MAFASECGVARFNCAIVKQSRMHVVAAAQRSAHWQLVGPRSAPAAVESSDSSAVARVIDSLHATLTVPLTTPVAFRLVQRKRFARQHAHHFRQRRAAHLEALLSPAAPEARPASRSPSCSSPWIEPLRDGVAPFAGFSTLICAVVTASDGSVVLDLRIARHRPAQQSRTDLLEQDVIAIEREVGAGVGVSQIKTPHLRS